MLDADPTKPDIDGWLGHRVRAASASASASPSPAASDSAHPQPHPSPSPSPNPNPIPNRNPNPNPNPVHQELFTRLLERMDCLDIDAMSEVRVRVRVG